MTAAGHMALEDELKHRIRVERSRLVQRIQEAIADDSNLAENSEYQAAKAEQENNEAHIADLGACPSIRKSPGLGKWNSHLWSL